MVRFYVSCVEPSGYNSKESVFINFKPGTV